MNEHCSQCDTEIRGNVVEAESAKFCSESCRDKFLAYSQTNAAWVQGRKRKGLWY
ncbi:hypothetical protein ACFO4E_12810 [Nocardiopsis mangrovi]|uniref:TRASH domain-containing protein n=1 Tax=Nocardiopsis mangrovi TaxID=1179818 RepID=A0ABV9DV29_9ACTN